MWNLLGGAIGALGSIYGAQQQNQSQQQANALNFALGQENIANQQAMNQQNIAMQEQINQTNLNQQTEFATKSAGWHLDDIVSAAKRDGINPLAALGVGGSSFSNLVAPQGQAPINSAVMKGTTGLGQAYGLAGQELGRAIGAIQSPEDQFYSAAKKMLGVENDQLQNDLLRAQISKLNAPGNPPGVPAMDDPGVKPGQLPTVQMGLTPSGNETPIPPREIGQLGFFHPSSLYWMWQNEVLPTFGMNKPAAHKDDWFNPATGWYQKDSPYWVSPSGGYGGRYNPADDPWR